ncbi:putative arginine biosynthesis-related protein [Kockovaella imperatae]|uniref:Arginine biosynthesis bifunctional protein ArgJ, mitochondrial n=1 Tax=Kockovaella imperatae TaxID=4999 RepID=A0A1Y1URE8_9TREE|nr:putative arginine biosynthesis-related protein [Kockovaella imperatae]ORX40026.1 putative arginine biosynthesis-related protein [Kockovaella imperatae]
MPPTPSSSLRAVSSRSFHISASLATPNKDHHVRIYPAEAFPKAFAVASTHAGIKKVKGALDLGLLASTSNRPTSAAACMTRNVFKAAPVTVTADLLHSSGGRAGGLIMNSGCANAVTGKQGLENAWRMSKGVTEGLQSNEGTLVMSTGVIGQQVPIENIEHAIPTLTSNLESTSESWSNLALAFMTTDTFPKLRTREFQLNGQTIRMVGIDKGAGMIAPSMGPPPPPHATLLGVIATDAAVEPKTLQSALQYAVDRSFNSITVDGDMSTNDTILCFANGAASQSAVELDEKTDPAGYKIFRDELRSLAEELAQLVVRDGEGATKFVTVRVKGAATYEMATKVARTIASSPLVKTAMYGEDANWGRILCAVGYSPDAESTISPTSVSVAFQPPSSMTDTTPFKVLTNGEPEQDIDETRAKEVLNQEDIEIVVDLGCGSEEVKVWTCDFSHDYVTINGSYRS